ncbi:Chlorophyll a-b binding protein 6, chloroplastic [Auxenochlorella protothecoides]|uniref:Chlorophyll a-b binding protein, chloroplastic n=1 Tax=Auxenochlorella protothecoides TaxID=3075 RepID=A0A087SFN6_AUXPR|nr:Chlorophyll a-b binding protein 6, chloroplastic [Auxenochlorella protothecoides]KFM24540.1 Chlorophyll a-b binding protein 6, chloroplastic [Auxenochlorella protothecoides]RMZ53219.1 hypothetical protein APUTEX25_005208 [Auxenochlorella protothecoides]|eukprot:RMZ53219.1 hypothetical protein APUTEX25_005208 [Auxenochlorella protothecoides]
MGPSNGSRVVMAGSAGNWFPGADTPDYLNKLPASYGFGILGAELLGQGDWYSAPLPVINGEPATYLGVPIPLNLGELSAIEFIAIGSVEILRNGAEGERRIWPGGQFDPLGLSKGNLEELKTKEIKNGRLAMLAFLGIISQHAANGLSPLQALGTHLGDPWANNFATNSVAVPFDFGI